VAIDACGRAAGLATIDFYASRGLQAIPGRGPLAANTAAGAISGWQEALAHSARLGGRSPVSRLLQDAIWYARNSAPVTQSQVNFTTRFLNRSEPQMGQLGDHQVPEVNTLRKYPAVACTLQTLADKGLDDYYRGSVARAIAAEHERLGGPLRLGDLRAQRASSVPPLSVKSGRGQALQHGDAHPRPSVIDDPGGLRQAASAPRHP
jgi:gamma-glutamyltranspeptidase/glutathione hydrolase